MRFELGFGERTVKGKTYDNQFYTATTTAKNTCIPFFGTVSDGLERSEDGCFPAERNKMFSVNMQNAILFTCTYQKFYAGLPE